MRALGLLLEGKNKQANPRRGAMMTVRLRQPLVSGAFTIRSVVIRPATIDDIKALGPHLLSIEYAGDGMTGFSLSPQNTMRALAMFSGLSEQLLEKLPLSEVAPLVVAIQQQIDFVCEKLLKEAKL